MCEDAINDPATCTVGATCTGCTDADTRDDGVTCAEIEAYSSLGATGAYDLLTHLRANPCASGMQCTNGCGSSNDGACDDGGAGSVRSSCTYGTDCTDCGARP